MLKMGNSNRLTLTEDDFLRLSKFITSKFGIKLPKNKKILLETRLRKRLVELGLESFKQYIDYLFIHSNSGIEIVELINRVSTNKTDFFREDEHFRILTEEVLPQLFNANSQQKIRVWSAGCSSGEEVYSLAIVLEEYALENEGFEYEIIGTDISTKVLDIAKLAIYPAKRIENISMSIKKKYFLRSKNKELNNVRLIPAIRKKVKFVKLNFMDEDYSLLGNFDIVFCRNVLIYFDKETQYNVLKKISDGIVKKGYLFLGHSESLAHFDLPFETILSTVYRKITVFNKR